MGHSNFNMRLDDELRANTYPILEKYGLTPSQAVRMFFNQIANTGEIPLSFDWASYKPNETTAEAIPTEKQANITNNPAWDAGQAVFGQYHSGRDDLSQQVKLVVSERIKAKYGKDTA